MKKTMIITLIIGIVVIIAMNLLTLINNDEEHLILFYLYFPINYIVFGYYLKFSGIKDYIWITTLVHTPMFISFLIFFFNENIRWQLLCRISAITVLISIIMIEYQLYKCYLLPRKKSSEQEAAPTDEITDYNPFKK